VAIECLNIKYTLSVYRSNKDAVWTVGVI